MTDRCDCEQCGCEFDFDSSGSVVLGKYLICSDECYKEFSDPKTRNAFSESTPPSKLKKGVKKK